MVAWVWARLVVGVWGWLPLEALLVCGWWLVCCCLRLLFWVG